MDVTQLPISQIVPHDKEVRLAKKVNALVDALERYNLADRAGDDYQWLVRYKDWIVDDFHNVFNPLDNSTVNERKSAYVEGFIHPDRYKVMYDKLKELGSVKDYIASLRTDSEKASSQKKYSLLELEKKDQLKLSRLRREKLDYIERMKIEAYEAVKEGDYLIFTTLTSTPGFERVFNSGNPAVKKFTYQFAHDVAAAYLIAAGKKNTDEARRPILWDVCRYLRVFEYGDKNGRKHAHIFWRIKALPHYIANPHEVNRFSATDLRETLPGMSALWPHISTHQPLRYGGDAWTAAGFQWPKEIDANGAVVQKQVKPVDACISYVGAYINQATETELALRTYNILNKNDNVYNVKYDQEETIPCRVKPSRGFGKLRVRQLIATAPLSRLKELLPASPHLTMPPPPPNKHLPSWRLLKTELLRRLVKEGTLRPFYLELRHLPNLFQADLTDPMKQTRTLSYALKSSGRLAVPVTKNTAACEQVMVLKMKQFYDDFIIPLDCAKVLIGGFNYG